MSEDTIQFDADFDDVTFEEWRAEAERSLRGGSFERRLVSKTLDEIEVQPLYLDEDVDSDEISQFPAVSPFTRGSKATPGDEAWEIRQEFSKSSVKTSNSEILLDLERGVSGIRLQLDGGFRGEADGDGIVLRTLEDMEHLLEGVHLEMIGTAVAGGTNAASALGLLAALHKKRGRSLDEIRGTVGYDPLGELVRTGELRLDWDTSMKLGAALASWCRENAPKIRPIEVSSVVWHEGGASEGREVAFALGTATAYLRGLVENGLSIDDAAKSICFYVASGRDTFIEIAKLRALRTGWARIVAASGGSEDAQAISLHARTSRMTYTQRDPWVNMLRATSQTFAAAVGGAESLTVGPFDEVIGHADVFSRRIARNTQLILRDESHVGRVVDPAGGSYYIEHLTSTLSDRAWSNFQTVESAGGMLNYVQSGKAAADLDSINDQRDGRIAKRKFPITGVSEFPNIEEAAVVREQEDSVDASQGAGAARSTASAVDSGTSDASLIDAVIADIEAGVSASDVYVALTSGGGTESAPALISQRYASLWEALRDASDEAKERPSAFLANIGEIPQHRPRASFAQNVFQAGGIVAPNNDGYPDADAVAAAFKESGADIACICSTDAIYGEVAADVAEALKGAGAKEVYVAGRPGDQQDAWETAGVDKYIFMGADLLSVLTDTLIVLGVIDASDAEG